MLQEHVRIVEFDSRYAKDFARLNYQWIEEFFEVESHDREVLDAPEEQIIQNGGQILFAVHRGEVVGTVALVPYGDDAFELAKMAVFPGYKGQKIGKRLMLRALDYAIQVGKKRVVIVSNTLLVTAINLYLQFGFKPIALAPDEDYERVNIKLEKKL